MQTFVVILQELGDTAFDVSLTIQLFITTAKFLTQSTYREEIVSLSSEFGESRDA